MSPKGRPPTGQLILGPNGKYSARVVRFVDGERVRARVQLDTNNLLAARRKLERLLADPTAPVTIVKTAESFEAAAERIYRVRLAEGVVAVESEIGRIRNYANPVIGKMPVDTVTPGDVNAVLDRAKAEGLARQTVSHVRAAVRVVYEALRREGVVTLNPVEGAAMPRFRSTVTKERAVLTDDELLVYLAWAHPQESRRLAVLRRQTMSCVARCFGGLRTGDLHALTWASFEADFSVGWAPRKKTKRPQRIEVPEMLRPILRDWWERLGRPAEGPVFPVLKGERAGEAKTVGSHAKAFRRDLMRAFGIERWDRVKSRWVQGRPMSPRELELFSETAQTLPVDFHSWRRAFTQALADVGLSAQQATALSGHASLSAHARYLASAGKVRQIPDEALPRLQASTRPKSDLAKSVSMENLWRARKDSNLRPSASEGEPRDHETLEAAVFSPDDDQALAHETPQNTTAGLNPWPELDPVQQALALALKAAVDAGRFDLVGDLTRELGARRQAASPAPGVTSLESRRRKGSE